MRSLVSLVAVMLWMAGLVWLLVYHETTNAIACFIGSIASAEIIRKDR